MRYSRRTRRRKRRATRECALAQDTAALDPNQVIERAAALKVLIADGGTPAGRDKGSSATTMQHLIDDSIYQDTMLTIGGATPSRIAALVPILAQPFCDYFSDEALLALVERLDGESYERAGPTGGISTDFGSADGFSMSCSGEVADVTFAGTRVGVFYKTSVIAGTSTQITAYTTRRSSRITRLDSDTERVVVSSCGTNVQTFPFHPLPAELARQSDGGTRRVSFLPSTSPCARNGNRAHKER